MVGIAHPTLKLKKLVYLVVKNKTHAKMPGNYYSYLCDPFDKLRTGLASLRISLWQAGIAHSDLFLFECIRVNSWFLF